MPFSRSLLRDRPLRGKLILAFLAVALIPLLILGGWSAFESVRSGVAAAESTLEDRLRIASLLWKAFEDKLGSDARSLAGDNAVIINLELGLPQPLAEIVATLAAREGLDGAFILDERGGVAAAAGEAGRIAAASLPSQDWEKNGRLASLSRIGPLVGPGGEPEAARLWIVAREPILSYQGGFLGWAATLREVAPGAPGLTGAFLDELARQIGLPFLLHARTGGALAGDIATLKAGSLLKLPEGAGTARGEDGRSYRVASLELGELSGTVPAEASPALLLSVAYPRLRILQSFAVSLATLAILLLLALAASFFLGRRLAATLTRPILALTAGAQTIAAGRYELRVPVESLDEIGILAGEFNLMAERLAASLGELSLEVRAHAEAETRIRGLNAELQEANAGLEGKVRERTALLENSLAELRAAQDRLIAAERYALSNRLSARLAHELNTPLGATLSAAHSLADSLETLIPALPDFLAGLDRDGRRLFSEAVERGLERSRRTGPFPGGALLQLRLEAELEGAGWALASALAASLAELGLAPPPPEFLDQLGHPRAVDILRQAEEICAAWRMAGVVRMAGGRATEVVKALREALEGESDPNEARELA
jgi:HAMP domain-containing protein